MLIFIWDLHVQNRYDFQNIFLQSFLTILIILHKCFSMYTSFSLDSQCLCLSICLSLWREGHWTREFFCAQQVLCHWMSPQTLTFCSHPSQNISNLPFSHLIDSLFRIALLNFHIFVDFYASCCYWFLISIYCHWRTHMI